VRLDAITAEPRPRNAWEATDLGMAMVRQEFQPVYAAWFAVALPLFLLLHLLCWGNWHWIPWLLWRPARLVTLTGYDLRYLNTDTPIPKLVAALQRWQRWPRGVFCFYGPAGTGKSELARHIADAQEKPLLVKLASDLLDKYVGETEQRIAEMFSDARQREVVLVQDEADSFLHDRCSACQFWEVTQANELLAQIEAFNGIFNCHHPFDRHPRRRQPGALPVEDSLRCPQTESALGVVRRGVCATGGELAEAKV